LRLLSVLEFLSGDPEQEYFAEGMVEGHHRGIVTHQMAVSWARA